MLPMRQHEVPDAPQRIGRSLAWLVAAAVIPLLLFAGGVAWVVIDQKQAAMQDHLSRMASALRVATDHELLHDFPAIDMLASAPSTRAGDMEGFREQAKAMLELNPDWHNVLLIDPASYAVVASIRPLPRQTLPDSLKAEIDIAVHSRARRIAGVYAAGTVDALPTVLLLTPVVRDGAVSHVLAVTATTAPFNKLLAIQDLPKTWTGAIIDPHMIVAGRSRAPEPYVGAPTAPTLIEKITQNHPGLFPVVTQEGIRTYAVFDRSPTTGWSVALGLPENEINDPIRQMLLQIHGGGAVLIGIGLLVSALIGRSIIQRSNAYENALHDSENRLQASLDEFHDLVARIPVGVFNLVQRKTDGRPYFKFASERFCEQLGLSAETIYRDVNRVFDAIHPDDLAPLKLQIEVSRNTNQRLHAEVRLRFPNASRWLMIEAAVAVLPNGDTQWKGIQYDITERKQHEAELEHHRAHLEELVEQRTSALMATEARSSHLLQSSADGLFGVDPKGRISFINSAACKMLGVTAEEVVGRLAHPLFHHSRPDGSPYPIEECPAHQAMISGNEVRVDHEVYWHADGHPIPVMYATHPMLKDGVNIGSVISFIDISEQRAAALAREQAVIAAENLARLRSEFVANMSHEIRTPLHGVLGFAQIGLRNAEDPAKVRNAFNKILTSGNLLLGIIDDILDFSKIEAGKIHITPTEIGLHDCLTHTIEIVAERAAAKKLALRLDLAPDMPPTCIADELRLSQILLNLLSNAVKFTATGSVTLAVRRDGDTISFRVIDTGIGIAPEHLDKLFNPFEQADGSVTRKFGGTGLGLAICKRLAELMGGSIRVESEPGVGSTFELCLPYVAPLEAPITTAGEAAPTPPTASHPLAGLRILAVDDNEINQRVLEDFLIEEGARVTLAETGQTAVDCVVRDGCEAFDVVLMDLQMPDMNGYEATRLLQVLAPDLPIIAQTAHASAEERQHCLSAGMVGYVTKPFDFDELTVLIRRHAFRHTSASPQAPG